jgi:hypothetical protein
MPGAADRVPGLPSRWLGGFALPNRGLFAIGTATVSVRSPPPRRTAAETCGTA